MLSNLWPHTDIRLKEAVEPSKIEVAMVFLLLNLLVTTNQQRYRYSLAQIWAVSLRTCSTKHARCPVKIQRHVTRRKSRERSSLKLTWRQIQIWRPHAIVSAFWRYNYDHWNKNEIIVRNVRNVWLRTTVNYLFFRFAPQPTSQYSIFFIELNLYSA